MSSEGSILIKYYYISVTEHFTAIFKPKWPKMDNWSETQHQLSVVQILKLKENILHSVSHSNAIYTTTRILSFWGLREDLVELFFP